MILTTDRLQAIFTQGWKRTGYLERTDWLDLSIYLSPRLPKWLLDWAE